MIEDDADDHDIFLEAFSRLKYPNKVIFFADSQKALEYLNQKEITPFMIISDINMPVMDGFSLRSKIRENAELHIKCIPYLFFTTASAPTVIIEAYSLSVQGFFVKPDSIGELATTIRIIMEYWQRCMAPNNF